MPSNSQYVAQQLETVDPMVHDWFETSNTLAQWLRSGTKDHQVSAFNTPDLFGQAGLQAFRIVIKKYRGGDYRAMNLDGGDYGSGSSMAFAYMTTGYYATTQVLQFTQLAIDAMSKDSQSIVKFLKSQLGDALEEMQAYDESGCFGDGTGVLATGIGTGAAPSGTNPTYYLEPAFGPQRLRVNQPVGVWDTTLATYKNSGTVRVASFDVNAKTVTLSGTVTNPSNADKITWDGLGTLGPLSQGSYRNGIYTFQNNATSGSTLGLSRAAVPEIVTPSVNAGGPLVPAHGLLLGDIIIQRRDENAYRGLQGVLHQAQRAQILYSGIAISDWHRSNADKMIDIVPQNTKADSTVPLAGVMHRISKKADRTRVDWLNKDMFGYVNLHKVKFAQRSNGERLFEQRSSSGTVLAGWYAMVVQADNLYSADPGAAGFIYNLAIPSGY